MTDTPGIQRPHHRRLIVRLDRVQHLARKAATERAGLQCSAWSACGDLGTAVVSCEDPGGLRDGTISVEVHENGRVMRSGLKGDDKLDHLDVVVVRGKVSRDDAGNVIVVGQARGRETGSKKGKTRVKL